MKGCTYLIGLFLIVELNAAAAKQPVRQAQDRPNILFIFIDDQGYYDLGCYGATEVKTPRIDALAENGVRFTDYYAAAPICSPSRAGLLTGCYPRRTGNEIWVHRPDATGGIPPSRLTVAELFKDAGYATACIGKWHLGFQEQYLPKNQGFDYYFGILHNLDSFEVAHFEDEGGMPSGGMARWWGAIRRRMNWQDSTQMKQFPGWKQAGEPTDYQAVLPLSAPYDVA